MEKTIECLREMTKGRLWIVFGCGGDRDRAKRPIMGQIAATAGDVVVLTSDNPRSEAPEAILRDVEEGVKSVEIPQLSTESLARAGRGYIVRGDRREAIELALSCASPGDVVLIAGKGHETYQLVGDKVLHFDDREVVTEFFESRGHADHEEP
jgi:UDP-N-acetylmuramoyl-L-alanyl-D-glutamate--2,6-diaminopimelate ligase